MKNRSLLILGIVLFFLISLVFLYFRRQHLLNLNQSLVEEQTELISQPRVLNEFPLLGAKLSEVPLATYLLRCNFEEIELYQNYYQAPLLPGDWRCLAAVRCQYFNSNNESEILYLPLRAYQAETKQNLLMGSRIQFDEESHIIDNVASKLTVDWYEWAIENTLKGEAKAGAIVEVDVSFPDPILDLNQSQGAGFELVQGDNPVYTMEDLLNFYQTGSTQYLPSVDNKAYFWPIVGYLFL